MKRHFLLIKIIVLSLLIFPPLISFGAIKSVTLTWTISDPSDIQGYKLYYSYNENMADKIWHQNCGPATEQSPGTFSMTCDSVQIDHYPVYFTIAAITQNEEIESTPQIVTSDSGTNISIVKDFKIINTGQTTFTTLAVNFQPDSSNVPTGFVKDWGASFEDNRTPNFGWLSPLPTQTRDRDNSLSPDQSYDTFIMGYPNHTWEAAIPNWTYRVTVCAGDVSYPVDESNSITVENVSFINVEKTTTDSRWIERTKNVTVTDGRLTVTFKGANPMTCFCWIKIESI